jgi:hypothetical protein
MDQTRKSNATEAPGRILDGQITHPRWRSSEDGVSVTGRTPSRIFSGIGPNRRRKARRRQDEHADSTRAGLNMARRCRAPR